VVTAQRDLLANEQQLAIIEGRDRFSSVLLVQALAALGRVQSGGRAGQTQTKDIITP